MRIDSGRRRRGRLDVRVAVALVVVACVLVGLAIDGRTGTQESASAKGPAAPPTSVAGRERGDKGSAPASGQLASTPGREATPNVTTSAAVPASVPASAAGADVPAAWSLADARIGGDDRAPPIERTAEEPATPAWQLDDHQGYARREQDRRQATQRAFVEAADRELPLLDQQIEQGRAMGLPPEQLAKGEEKRRRIAEMRARMQAELGASAPAP